MAIGAFGLLTLELAWSVRLALVSTYAWILMALSAIVGYALADLVSGIVHWLADRYGSEDTPFLGANYIRPFREHHTDPMAITRHGFIETNGSNCIISTPFMALALICGPDDPSALSAFFFGGTLTFSLAIFATNQFHKWAHMERAPWLARTLMRLSLILSPAHHGVHHNKPFDRNYCITVGMWNPLLSRWRLFERAESGLAAVTGARPCEEATNES
ncbi:MAG TPA: fatty acid desaturase family protein [Terriglobia bacterium]|nr:fatty acid desaturase family protein [Terriglobia bacterium]